MDPKKRRIEEPIEVGLGESNSTEDTDMSEGGKLENLSSKNEIMAGSLGLFSSYWTLYVKKSPWLSFYVKR